jgi:hypothetical protein
MDPSIGALLSRIEDLERGRPARLRADVARPAVAAVPEPSPVVVPAVPAVTAVPAEPAAVTLADMRRLWPAVVELVKAANAMLGVLLASASPASLSERELVLSFPAEAAFYKRKAEQDDYRRSTAEAVRNVTGLALSLRFELAEGSDEEPSATPAQAPRLTGEDLVARLVADFDAEEIVDHDQEGED